MTELTTTEPDTHHTATLTKSSDDELRELIDQATAILKERESSRMRDAITRIKALAKEHGLNVSINQLARKRGRPRTAQVGGSGFENGKM